MVYGLSTAYFIGDSGQGYSLFVLPPFLLPLSWNVDVKTVVPAATVDHEVILRMGA